MFLFLNMCYFPIWQSQMHPHMCVLVIQLCFLCVCIRIHICVYTYTCMCLCWWLSGQESTCQCKRWGFNPSVGKIPWRRAWQPTPVFLPGESHGQRSLPGYSPWGLKESDMTDWLSLSMLFTSKILPVCLRSFSLEHRAWIRGRVLPSSFHVSENMASSKFPRDVGFLIWTLK